MQTLSSQQASVLAKKRRHPGGRNARAQLIEVQDLLMADIRSPDTSPSARAQCARALETIEERLRILNGKPLPGQLRPDLDQKRNARRKPTLLASLPSDPPPADTPPSQAQS